MRDSERTGKLTISGSSEFFVSANAKCSQQEIVFHFKRINSAAFRNRALECIRPMCQIMFVVFMQRRVYRICFTFRIRSTKAKVTRQRIGSHNENGFCFLLSRKKKNVLLTVACSYVQMCNWINVQRLEFSLLLHETLSASTLWLSLLCTRLIT